MTDIIIIGGGPSGLTAALYALRAGKSVLLFEKAVYGGQISRTEKIENYPAVDEMTGADFSLALHRQVKNLGATFVKKTVESAEKTDNGFIVTAKGKSFESKAVIFALGVTPRKLGLENEDNFISRGISYCAVCDGAFFKEKDVAVVGGGETAFQDALYLSDICRNVYLIHRRDSFRASDNLKAKLETKSNIGIMTNCVVTALDGENILERITVKNTLTAEEKNIELSGVFVAIGQQPVTESFKNILPLDENGYVVCDEKCTVSDGVFVCGDCRQKDIRQLTTAVADGTVAAIKACEYIK